MASACLELVKISLVFRLYEPPPSPPQMIRPCAPVSEMNVFFFSIFQGLKCFVNKLHFTLHKLTWFGFVCLFGWVASFASQYYLKHFYPSGEFLWCFRYSEVQHSSGSVNISWNLVLSLYSNHLNSRDRCFVFTGFMALDYGSWKPKKDLVYFLLQTTNCYFVS